ncbi:MAG: glycosyltransferase [Gammaproteobacteria bacterium]|nr:glycosyltransferase [Gammaproteobacteria bacterium]
MTAATPLVSVIIPSFNHAQYVEGAILSVLNQTYTNIELLVFDDGSSDNSPELIAPLAEKNGFYFERQKNIGLPATLNKGIRMAKGKYVSFLASDDLFEESKIDLLVAVAEQLDSSYAVISGDARLIDDAGSLVSWRINRNGHSASYSGFVEYHASAFEDHPEQTFNLSADFGSYESLISYNYIPAMSVLVKKDALLDVGLYDEKIRQEDWSMWLKLAKKYKFKYVSEFVARYRVHAANSIATMETELKLDLFEILRGEKIYCEEMAIMPLWENSFYTKALYFIKAKGLRWWPLGFSESLIFMIFLFRRVVGRIKL